MRAAGKTPTTAYTKAQGTLKPLVNLLGSIKDETAQEAEMDAVAALLVLAAGELENHNLKGLTKVITPVDEVAAKKEELAKSNEQIVVMEVQIANAPDEAKPFLESQLVTMTLAKLAIAEALRTLTEARTTENA